MELFQWEVREGFGEHQIRIDLNRRNGRAFVRLDGRIIAPPIDSDHDEREFNVGSTPYRVIRRAREEFELELVPFVAPPYSERRRDRSMSTVKWPGLVLKLGVLGVLLVFISSFAEMGAAYFSPWVNFDEAEGAYSVKLPEAPKVSKERGMNVAEVETGECLFHLTSQKLDRKHYEYDDHKMLDDAIRSFRRQGAEIIETEVLNDRRMVAGRRVTMNFKGPVDGEDVDSTIEVLACTTYGYYVIAAAEYPREGKAPKMKIDRFFRSLDPGY